jgi:hypothetical protein
LVCAIFFLVWRLAQPDILQGWFGQCITAIPGTGQENHRHLARFGSGRTVNQSKPGGFKDIEIDEFKIRPWVWGEVSRLRVMCGRGEDVFSCKATLYI